MWSESHAAWATLPAMRHRNYLPQLADFAATRTY